jgi:hypothetical protein
MTTGYIAPQVLDFGLDYIIDHATALYICNALPGNYSTASTTYALGHKTGPTIAALSDRAPSGRKIVLSAIADGVVTGTGNASHWALVDGTGAVLLAAGPLFAVVTVGIGNPFTLTSIAIGFPAAS